MKPKILVVDDEHDLVNLVRYNLQKEGYEVICAYDGNSAISLTWEKRPDLIVLDLMLPDRSGVDICRQIKEDSELKNIPVIMLTARSSEQDRISGFEAGAEDYVVKPFSPKELVWRVKAMLGRMRKTLPNEMQIGPLSIYPDEYRVMVGNEEVALTQIEFKILLTLCRHPNMVKSREQILNDVWQEEAAEVLDRTVDAHVKRLRAKLGPLGRDTVETVRGVGYRLVLDTKTDSKTSSPTV